MSWMLVWLFVGWPLGLVVAIDHGVSSSHLRVSVHGNMLQDAPSCQHRIAQIELYNVHSTDSVRVHNISRSLEHTEVMDEKEPLVEGEGDYAEEAPTKTDCPSLDLPNQLHVTDFEPFEILPGQLAIVPVAFLPRFPVLESSASSPNIQTKYELADYLDIIESDIRRSNFETNSRPVDVPKYQVSAILNVNTNYGDLELPLEATSQRTNDFGLPDVVHFDDSIQRTVNHISVIKERAKHNITIMDQITLQSSLPGNLDCFDLYMRNPAVSAGLHVTEARVSRPHQMQLNVNGDSFSSIISDWSEITPSKRVFGDSDPTLMIPADGRKHYVVSICLNDDPNVDPSSDPEMETWIDKLEENSLGFLQLKTTRDTFFVNLEKSNSESSTVVPSDWSLPDTPRPSKHLHATPEILEETFLVSGLHSADISVDLKNISPQPVSIMRASIAVDTLRYFNESFEEIPDDNPKPSDFDNLGISLRLNEFNKTMPRPMRPGEPAVNAITINCTVDWKKFDRLSNEFRLVEVHGTVVVRGTTKPYLAFSDWERSLKSDLRSSIVYELPFRLKIYTGYLVFLVQDSTHPVEPLFYSDYYYDGLTGILHSFYPRHAAHTDLALNGEELAQISPDYMKGIEHEFRVFSTVNRSMALEELQILSDNEDHMCSVCDRFDAYIESAGGWQLIGDTEVPDLGKIFVQYRYPVKDKPTRYENCRHAVPELCTLRVLSEPSSGIHDISMFVYSGQLHLSQSETASPSGLDGHVYKNDGASIAGFEEVFKWFLKSKAGYSLRSVLGSTWERGKNIDRDAMLLSRYLHTLSRNSRGLDPTELNPIVLNAGAIAQGEVETVPLYITNYNPMPVTVNIDVGEVEGQMITIGRDKSVAKGDGNGIYDHFPPSSGGRVLEHTFFGPEKRITRGRFRGHTVGALRNFLMTDDIARSVLDRFSFRDDVTMSPSAIAKFPFLKSIFREKIVGRFRSIRHPRRFREDGWNFCSRSVHPTQYGKFQKKLDDAGRKLQGPIMISADRKTSRPLSICWFADGEPDDKKSDDVSIVIPPGGVARYDVSIRAPPTSVLEKDITQFLGTGLVLKTDHGEIIPILVSYEALKGKLELSHLPTVSGPNRHSNSADGSIHVPAGLFGVPSGDDVSSILIPPHNVHSFSDFARSETIVPRNASMDGPGVSLFMKSSFLRDVRLRKVEACNPWFEVSLVDQTSSEKTDPFLGVYIGTVQSVIACDSGNGKDSTDVTPFPSFFRCALNWLSRRPELQPRGCGSTVKRQSSLEDEIGANGGTEVVSIEKTINALKRAVLITEWNDDQPSFAELGTNESGKVAFKSGRRTKDSVVLPVIVDTILDAWHELQVAHGYGLLSLGTSLNALVEYNATPDEMSNMNLETRESTGNAQVLALPIHNITVTSHLDTPKLFMPSTTSWKTGGSFFAAPQVLEFEPTLVTNISYAMLPIRNPTGVPIRVRLRVAPRRKDFGATVLEKYTGAFVPPFVQGQQGELSLHGLSYGDWWDQRGAFMHADPHGDVIRTFRGVSIMSKQGARISMINPSYFASSSMILGCGPKCGIRNERAYDVESRSTIGAAAAAGNTLTARAVLQDDLLLSGQSASIDGAEPSAFGIPYGAMDEIVVPPYGEAEIGPLMFRPLGRARRMGCSALEGGRLPEVCSSREFKTMVFLENSLTGLEVVHLSGKTLVERLSFIEPESREFSDIELRNGFSTLLFSGVSEIEGNGAEPKPVVKEVLLQNQGDVTVVVEGVFLAPTNKGRGRKSTSSSPKYCSLGQFRILDCSKSFPHTAILPGQNLSFFVEHTPHCSKRKDFVRLTVDLESSSRGPSDAVVDHWQSPYLKLKGRMRKRPPLPRIDQASLNVGYEMSSRDFMACQPVSIAAASNHTHGERKLASSGDTYYYFAATLRSFWLSTASLILSIVLLIYRQRLKWMTTAVEFFQRYFNYTLRAHGKPLELPDSLRHAPKRIVRNWNLSFLCLAKADPSAAELQAHTRSQMRQTAVSRSEHKGTQRTPLAARPAEGTNEGTMPTSETRQASSVRKPTSGPSDRIRSSDAIFRTFNPDRTMEHGVLPVKLGWKTASSKGIINSETLAKFPLQLQTTELLQERLANPLKPHDGWPDSHRQQRGDDPSDLSSSVDEISMDNDVPKTVTGQSIVIPDDISTSLRSDEGDGDDEKSDNVVVPSPKPKRGQSIVEKPTLPIVSQKPVKKENAVTTHQSESSSQHSNVPKTVDKKSRSDRKIDDTTARDHKRKDTKTKGAIESRKVEKTDTPKKGPNRSLEQTETTEKQTDQVTSSGKSKRNQKRDQKKEVTVPEKQSKSQRGKGKKTKSKKERSTSSSASKEPLVSAVPASPPTLPRSPPVSPGFRPPPGLLPPPGFNGDSFSMLQAPVAPSLVSRESGDSLVQPPASAAVPETNGNSAPSLVEVPPESLLGTLSYEVEQPKPLPGLSFDEEERRSRLDFDVMDFLDGILDEGNHESPRISSNPWATDGNETHTTGLNTEALNLPSTDFFPSGAKDDDDEGDGKGDFYSSLLRE